MSFIFVSRVAPTVVRIGDENLLGNNSAVTFEIQQIINHPDYQSTENYNDIALVQLRGQVIFSTTLRPACLWQSNDTGETNALATGYGSTSFGGPSALHLMKVYLDINTDDECINTFSNDIRLETQLCAGDVTGQRDTCQVHIGQISIMIF